ncbi:unnamed protein product [Ranitomeya imitator]|uniref:BIG2 domain-containing protein n=1 Tax=Ranitomeya imitator TaxID=111125 RepID=A0ABN9KZY2_9NEOB|nr:unnamed protein product [Ranitomeya imitator]
MSSPIFRGFVLLGLLCLWVAPTEQALTITIAKDKNPIVVGQNLTLTVEGISDVNKITLVSWYQSDKVDPSKLIVGKVKTATETNLTGVINDTGAVIGATDNILFFSSFKAPATSLLTVQVVVDTEVATATTSLYNDP